MATGSTKVNAISLGGGIQVVAAPKGSWVNLHLDVTATAATATNIRHPLGVSSANVVWAEIGPGVSTVAFRVSYLIGASAVTQAPELVPYGLWVVGNSTSTYKQAYDSIASTGVPKTDGSILHRRLDSEDPNGSGLFPTFDTTNDLIDTVYKYSSMVTYTPFTNVPGDTLGAHFIGVLVKTAMTGTSISGQGVTPTCQALVC